MMEHYSEQVSREAFSIEGNIVDVVGRRIFKGIIHVVNGRIAQIEECEGVFPYFILPGFIDAHVHIESSMLVPSEFARLAVVHGTIGAVSDPHEIANVLGLAGVDFMLGNAATTPFRFSFGAPSCVPATSFETAGANLTPELVNELLQRKEIGYLAEMMNYPGVVHENPMVMKMIAFAHESGKPVDGHAPGLSGSLLEKYVSAGISTDHECSTIEEALEKIALGMKILIREGSAARNAEALLPLLATHPNALMFCSDDMHPDQLVNGHINLVAANALQKGYDLFGVLRCATLNPKTHYGLPNGLLQPGDPADFIVVEDLKAMNVKQTFIDGKLVAHNGATLLQTQLCSTPNAFSARAISPSMLQVAAEGSKMRVIQAIDGEIVTRSLLRKPLVEDGMVVADCSRDVLKLVSLNRYNSSQPAIAFINGFGLQQGAIASTVAHDSHNMIAVGTHDDYIARAINLLVNNKGGIVAVSPNGEKVLPLPVAGLMSASDGYLVAASYQEIDAFAKQMGCTLKAPFMTLSFMSLLVIPELKLSDRGLFDGQMFQPVGLFADAR